MEIEEMMARLMAEIQFEKGTKQGKSDPTKQKWCCVVPTW
jgi:hypothetical protein